VKRALVLLAVLALPAGTHAAAKGGEPVALVTAETQNQLLVVDLSSGSVIRRLPMPADPQNVETTPADDAAAVVSTKAGAVTLLSLPRLRVRRVFGGFKEPHIAAFSPNGRYLYVTDDARGQLVSIDVRRAKVAWRLFVCFGAHHLAFRPRRHEVWIACGERAGMIVVVRTTNLAHPRRIRYLGTGNVLAHDLAFSPNGRSLWLTSDNRSTVTVLDAATWPPRPRLTVQAGSPPQHVAFGRYAYVTSGNDGRLRIFSLAGRLLGTARTPAGSFNLGVDGGLVLTSSLTGGTLTALRAHGRRLWTKVVASAARDAAFAVLP
jgi:DNA-binding beta-propeller fold protein YncE